MTMLHRRHLAYDTGPLRSNLAFCQALAHGR
jgi:hypothetical protein